MQSLAQLKSKGEAPEWMTEDGYRTLKEGYLLEDETPRQMYLRVAHSVSHHLKKIELSGIFFDYMWRNWLCPSTPILSNAGTDRGLVISCYGIAVGDSLDQIYKSFHETAMLLKNGGGVGKYWGLLRSRGDKIRGNGFSDGLIPWIKVEEATLQSTSQGGVRRGSGCQYLPITSNEIQEYLDIRSESGDPTRRCNSNNFHHAVSISDEFMQNGERGCSDTRAVWKRFMGVRHGEGEPFVMFSDTANRDVPDCYKHYKLDVKASQLCTEIFLHSDPEHTYVCCLSSLNLARYEEWKDTNLVEIATWFLDGVMEEFLQKAKHIPGLEKAVRFAEKSRALGLGVLGWHTLLQSKLIPFDSFTAMKLNGQIFKEINDKSLKASRDMAKEYGEVAWTTGFGIRNTHRLAMAPTLSNSIISGGSSPGIEPFAFNYFAQKTAKGLLIRKNRQFEMLLEQKGKSKKEIRDICRRVASDQGSVKNISCMSAAEKEVYLTAREINQFAIVRQASQRQQFIDQGQSVNLFFAKPDSLGEEDRKKLGRYIHDVHFAAWKLGLKSLYYLHSESIINGDSAYREEADCKGCEG